MKPILKTLHHLYWDSTGPTRFLTLFLYPLAAFGLARAYIVDAPDTTWMFHLFNVFGVPKLVQACVWGTLVLYIWIARFVGLFSIFTFTWALRTTPLLGCSFWLALLTSNMFSDNNIAFGLMYGVVAILEAWVLSRNWLETT